MNLAEEATQQSSALPRPCLLIVDDEPGVRTMLRDFFECHDYLITEAGDGQEALLRYQEQPISLVITDISMPTKSGIELLHELHRRDPQLPVIMITGKPTVEAAVECIRTGATDFITKPFDLADIHRRVTTTLADRRRTAADELTGTVLVSHSDRRGVPAGYKIVRVLGQGNMGTVYLVDRDPPEPTQYAMKVLRAAGLDVDRRSTVLERFRREAQAALMVNHPNVVRILDYGTAEAEQNPYIVMEYLNGRSLRFLIARGDVPLANRLRILAQVADALTAIHAANICHRDIKPSNILVDEHLVAKLTDFGVARLPESDLTLTTSFVGSPAYMAPEAYVSARVDHRADLFSLGVVGYEFLVGTKPFTGENLPQMMNAIRHQAPALPRSLVPHFPPALEQLLMTMLEKDPRRRPQAAAEVAAQFREALARLGG